MRLGDLDALFREIKNSDWLPHERIEAMKMVREQPTIDAVPVCRCMDCAYFSDEKMLCNHEGNMVLNIGKTTYPNDYCSYGERKDGDG